MARGWESKSEEDQVTEAEAAKEARSRPRLSPRQRAQQQRQQSLVLSRAQIVSRLAAVTNARYREQLEKALNDLNEELATMDLENRLMD